LVIATFRFKNYSVSQIPHFAIANFQELIGPAKIGVSNGFLKIFENYFLRNYSIKKSRG